MRHQFTKEECSKGGKAPCYEDLKQQLRREMLEDKKIWLKSTGAKTLKGKFISAQNNQARSPIYESSSPKALAMVQDKDFRTQLHQTLKDEGLPFTELKTGYSINAVGLKVWISLKGKSMNRLYSGDYHKVVEGVVQRWLG